MLLFYSTYFCWHTSEHMSNVYLLLIYIFHIYKSHQASPFFLDPQVLSWTPASRWPPPASTTALPSLPWRRRRRWRPRRRPSRCGAAATAAWWPGARRRMAVKPGESLVIVDYSWVGSFVVMFFFKTIFWDMSFVKYSCFWYTCPLAM